jgi:hypothetical protein
MKGILTKTNRGWVVKQVVKEGPEAKLINQYPLVDNGHIDGLKLYDSNEGLEVEFEMVAGYDNNGPEHFPKYAKIITPEEAELKDWDVTLNDGLEDEPYISDDFQIGPDGAYEHTEDWTEELEEQYWKEQCLKPFATPEELERDGAYEHTEDMTPREKANDILDSFWLMDKVEPMLTEEQAKQCTLIAVDEIIKECYNWNGSDNVQWETKRFNYWNEVKQEIKNL